MHKSAFWMISLRTASQKWDYPVRGQERVQWMLLNGSEDTAGHLPLRIPVISAEVDVCWPGPCAGQVHVLARLLSNSGRNKLRRGERYPVGLGLQEKAEYGVLGCCHRGVVLSVGLEVTQDWVTAMVEECPPKFMSN